MPEFTLQFMVRMHYAAPVSASQMSPCSSGSDLSAILSPLSSAYLHPLRAMSLLCRPPPHTGPRWFQRLLGTMSDKRNPLVLSCCNMYHGILLSHGFKSIISCSLFSFVRQPHTFLDNTLSELYRFLSIYQQIFTRPCYSFTQVWATHLCRRSVKLLPFEASLQ